jgi:hypothetical protein
MAWLALSEESKVKPSSMEPHHKTPDRADGSVNETGAHRAGHRLFSNRSPLVRPIVPRLIIAIIILTSHRSGYLPLIIYLGYTRSNPRPSLIR